MKRLVYLLMAVSLLAALVPAAVSGHTEDVPLVVDLLAGQTEDIGDVLVWNDADTLYVKFVYEGDDCGFIEVHLQVDEGAFSEDILTKKGNPIPGQFEKSRSGGCFAEHTFTYDLEDEGFACDDNLLIAAHAALGLEESMTIISDTSTDVTEVNGSPVTADAVLANEPVGYPNCATYAPDGTGSAWDNSVSIPGAHWIWNTLDPERPIEGDVVTFNKTFNVPGLPNGGTLHITADNGYEVSLNGVLLGSAQLGPGFPETLKETTDTTPQAGEWGVASQGWQSVESYSLLELTTGQNTLMITAANEYMWNTTDQYEGKDYYYGSWDPSGGSVNPDPFPGYGIGVDNICRNPGGLIFKATLDYYVDGETAWGDGTRFTEDKNWATYFTYTVQCEMPEVWPEGGTLSVAYEDLPISGGNDWDYNDFVVDIDTLATFWGTSADRDLIQIDFTVRPEAKLAGYTHVMHLDADTFACDGTYELYRDGSLVESGNYVDSIGIDVVLVPNTGSAPNVVLLTISFEPGCEWAFPTWDPNLYHGENLFYDPYLHVNNTGQDIHMGDVRMLTVPVDWQWPTPDGNRICNVYPKVTGCVPGPPSFVPDWWTP